MSPDDPNDVAQAFLDSRKREGVTEVTSDQSPEQIASKVKNIVDSQKSTVNTLTAVKSALTSNLFIEGWESSYAKNGYLTCSNFLGSDLRSQVASSVSQVDLSRPEGVADGEVELPTGGYFKNLSKEDYEKSPKAIGEEPYSNSSLRSLPLLPYSNSSLRSAPLRIHCSRLEIPWREPLKPQLRRPAEQGRRRLLL